LLHGVPSGSLASLAVLPLEDLSRDPDQAYFADGMTDELITELTKIGALRVIAASSVQGFRDTRLSPAQIAQRLSVGALVVGSILRSGDRVRINARLVEARDARQLWAESYERGLRDILGLQSEVALDIAHGIQARLTPGEQRRFASRNAVNPAAYQDYLKGRFYLKRLTEGFRDRPPVLQSRDAADPNCARHTPESRTATTRPRVWMSPSWRSRKAGPRPKAPLDSTLADPPARNVRAVSGRGLDRRRARVQTRDRINPGYALHQHYGYVLGILGRHARRSSNYASRGPRPTVPVHEHVPR
jgi:TolB-like protein